MLAAPGLVLGQEPDGPNEEQVKILLSGVAEWNEWREANPDAEIDLARAKLSDMNLIGANLWSADLAHADLAHADLTGADLFNSDLTKADLGHAILTKANLRAANLTEAYILGANFEQADLSFANLQNATQGYLTHLTWDLAQFLMPMRKADMGGINSGGTRTIFMEASLLDANLTGTDLRKADLTGADLKRTNLAEADLTFVDLTGADLTEANLTGADFRFSDFTETKFEPKTIPNAREMLGAFGLRTLHVEARFAPDETLAYDIGAIVELRESAKATGLTSMERDLTCSIERIRNGNPDRPRYARVASHFLFDLTCNYGAEPDRPLFLIGFFFVAFVVVYALMLESPNGGRLYVDYLPKRGEKDVTLPLNACSRQQWGRPKPTKDILPRLIEKTRFTRICIYFSLQSMFNIGYREFHIGSWIARLQRRPYSMRAVGPLRVASGLQSLLGVALLALWLLCAFGRPFG